MKKLPFVFFAFGLTGILSVGVFWTAVAQAKPTETFTLDVACDGTTLSLNSADPEFPFARSDIAVVNGNIYPEGSLPSGVTDFDPSAPGEIGTWRCLFASLAEPPLIGAVTYYFALTGDDSEESLILVQGLNSHQFPGSVPRLHAIVGGTGEYAGATGEVLEEVIGTNVSGCFNLRFDFRIRVSPGFDDNDE